MFFIIKCMLNVLPNKAEVDDLLHRSKIVVMSHVFSLGEDPESGD